MPNFTLHFPKYILAIVPNASIGLGCTNLPYTPFYFGGSQVTQMTPTMGVISSFNPRSNLVASGWKNQPCRQYSTQVPFYNLKSLVLILTNTFGMMNPPLSFGFTPSGGQFHTLGNPQPGDTSDGGSFYNPHQNIPTGMVPNQPLMNHPGGGSYHIVQCHGSYQNHGWDAIPQTHYF
jgi:hypothetical protein